MEKNKIMNEWMFEALSFKAIPQYLRMSKETNGPDEHRESGDEFTRE